MNDCGCSAADNMHACPRVQLLILYLTAQCQLRCEHCFYREHRAEHTQPLSYDEVARILRSIPRRLWCLVLTGGEPTMADSFTPLSQLLGGCSVADLVVLCTNGYDPDAVCDSCVRLTPRTSQKLLVQVSLDGPEAVHDEIRGCRGAYAQAIETIHQLISLRRRIGVPPTICRIETMTTITSHNYKALEALLDDVLAPLSNDITVRLNFMRHPVTQVTGIPPQYISRYVSPSGPTLAITDPSILHGVMQILGKSAPVGRGPIGKADNRSPVPTATRATLAMSRRIYAMHYL